MLRNGWIPTGPPLPKPTSARVALDRQHLVLDNGTRDPDLLVGLSRRAETYTTDFLRGVRSLRNHGSPLGSPSELPEVGFVDSLLSGREDETLVVGDADPAFHHARLPLNSSSYAATDLPALPRKSYISRPDPIPLGGKVR